jgi:beta-glucosidase
MRNELIFPEGFLWGTATAGHQVEGHNDKSDWWKFEQEGKIYDGTVSGRAVDYWNRYEEDHELMSKLGCNAFRLGVEWAKIEPEDGCFDKAAIDRYRKILQSLKDRNIKICLTIFHWVLPLWFAEMGGWEHPRAVDRFIKFAEVVVKELGEFPDLWVTLNEPTSPATAGYLVGIFPPEKKSFFAYCKVMNRFLHAHARCYDLIHREVRSAPDGGPVMVGTAYAYQHMAPFGSPGIAGALESIAAPVAAHISYKAWDNSIATGWAKFPYGPERIAHLKDSCDFCGVNYYTRMSWKFDPSNRERIFDPFAIHEGIEQSQMGWENYPPGFYAILSEVWKKFKKPIYITENGCADPDDTVRPTYTLEHLAQVHRAIEDDIDVRGYFHWSFTDNFEWREGFVKKLGLVACDYADPELKRVPRQSAHMYSEIIAGNGITREVVEKYAPGAMEGVLGAKWRV